MRKINPQKAMFDKLNKKKKAVTIPQLKKKAWSWFSQYIRLRDCLKSTGSLHEGKCYTCGHLYSMKSLQSGHFIPGRSAAVLFQEDQVHAQCYVCNIHNHGAWPEYYEHMVKDWGLEKVQQMMFERHLTHQWEKGELEELTKKYQQKVIDLINI